MDGPVILSAQASKDLREIIAFIARNNLPRARAFGRELLERARSLAAHPEMGRVVPELDNPDVREIVHRAYRIIYEVSRSPDSISILRFWHGARGTPEI